MIVYAATNLAGNPIAVAQGVNVKAEEFLRRCSAQLGQHADPIVYCWAAQVERDREQVRYFAHRAAGRVRTIVGFLPTTGCDA